MPVPDVSVNSEVGDHGRASLVARPVRLFVGLWLFGFALALMVRADLGLGPIS